MSKIKMFWNYLWYTEIDGEYEKTYALYFGKKHMLNLTIDYFDKITKETALQSINRALVDQGFKPIPFNLKNVCNVHIKCITRCKRIA